MPIHLEEFRPHAAVAPHVELYWRGAFDPAQEAMLTQRVVPNGYVELIVHLGDAHCMLWKDGAWGRSPMHTLIGLYSEPYEVRFTRRVDVFGIRFKPEGWQPMIGLAASDLIAGHGDIADVMGAAHADLCERIREARDTMAMIDAADGWFLRRIAGLPAQRDYVHQAAELIRRAPSNVRIEDLPGLVCIGQRQLERAFKQRVGVTPKQYQRMQRLNRVNRLLLQGRRMDLTQVALACGYFDQAHFIREFRTFIGERPGRFLRERDNYIVIPNAAYERDLPHEPL
ncbi:MAG: AraC family transcriptional regulator [Flavobacteriales bacterium]|nr:AraC family transcriptional regulator [Flavobacteriales bacterium]